MICNGWRYRAWTGTGAQAAHGGWGMRGGAEAEESGGAKEKGDEEGEGVYEHP